MPEPFEVLLELFLFFLIFCCAFSGWISHCWLERQFRTAPQPETPYRE
jgi:hypothetical protein